MAASTATRAWRWIAVLLLACACATTFVAKPIGTMFRETWTTRQELPHNQINAIVQMPDVKQQLTTMGLTVDAMTPEQLTRREHAYTAAWKRIIGESGFKPQ